MNPITATVTKPEPPPEPVRPRLHVAIRHDGLGHVPWSAVYQPFLDHDSAARTVDGNRGARVIVIPTDAEIERDARIAEKHARYVAALEAGLVAWRHGKSSAVHLSYEADKARAEWEAERGKA
jgi:hypothetical protein